MIHHWPLTSAYQPSLLIIFIWFFYLIFKKKKILFFFFEDLGNFDLSIFILNYQLMRLISRIQATFFCSSGILLLQFHLYLKLKSQLYFYFLVTKLWS